MPDSSVAGAVLFTAQGLKHVSDEDILESYKGTIQHGVRHGHGVYSWVNGIKYRGAYVEGRKEGQGRLELPDGSCFEGTFQGGELEGKGTRVWQDGTMLRCNFVLGEAEGEGELQSSKGWTYKGSFKNNRPNGKGIREDTNGGRYEGHFCNGQFHGHGVLRSVDGYVYDGNWQQGQQHGKGQEFMPSGQKFEGHFSNGKYHGIGCLALPDGRVYTDVRFHSGELEQSVQMELEYLKTVNKKNVELPVPIDLGTVVPTGFVISVRILCKAQAEPDATDGGQPAADSHTGNSGLQTMTAESGRSVYLQLQQGHEDPDGTMQPLKQPVFRLQERTTTPPEATGQEGQAEEALAAVESLCAVTAAGECSFQGFQIGGEGLAALEAGPYTLVVSSIGQQDERILVQLNLPKGKKK